MIYKLYLTVSFVDVEDITVIGVVVVEIYGEVVVTDISGVTYAFCVTITAFLGGISALSFSKGWLFFLLGNIVVRSGKLGLYRQTKTIGLEIRVQAYILRLIYCLPLFSRVIYIYTTVNTLCIIHIYIYIAIHLYNIMGTPT